MSKHLHGYNLGTDYTDFAVFFKLKPCNLCNPCLNYIPLILCVYFLLLRSLEEESQNIIEVSPYQQTEE